MDSSSQGGEHMTGAQMDCIEKMLTRFIEKSVKGVKKDGYVLKL
jgi:hypothetical protein